MKVFNSTQFQGQREVNNNRTSFKMNTRSLGVITPEKLVDLYSMHKGGTLLPLDLRLIEGLKDAIGKKPIIHTYNLKASAMGQLPETIKIGANGDSVTASGSNFINAVDNLAVKLGVKESGAVDSRIINSIY